MKTSRKPKIAILATGGTIAGVAPIDTQMTGYAAGSVTVDDLIAAVPALREIANITGEQIANIDSKDMTSHIWIKLLKRCRELTDNPDIDGIVITHGTDSMEETAYFLNLTVNTNKPIVLVGSMRPATAISADGPVNLLNAVKLAGSKGAVGCGVMIAMNDEILGARDATKTNTSSLSTFKAPELGVMGYFTGGEPCIYYKSTRRHTTESLFADKSFTDRLIFANTVDIPNISNSDLWSNSEKAFTLSGEIITKKESLEIIKQYSFDFNRVAIIYAHVDTDGIFAVAAARNGFKGIVYAGYGDGSVPKLAEPTLIAAHKFNDIVVVRSSRTGNGRVVAGDAIWTENEFINGDTLSPQKARILLQLALMNTNNSAEIQAFFDEY